MLVQILVLIAGFIILIKGAEWLVSGASSLAKRYGVSELVIGLTIVAFGTSAPELVVNIFASAEGHSDLVFGNVLGSNMVNLFVILGIVGIITPLSVQTSTIWKEIPISLFAMLILFILANDFLVSSDKAALSRIDGSILLICFGLFLVYTFFQMKKHRAEADTGSRTFGLMKISLLVIAGLAGLVLGGRLIIDSSSQIARMLNISEKIIGLTIMAAGTSLPELATSIVAAMKKNADLAIGNIVGSNIFNIFLILGASSVIMPVYYNSAFDAEIYLISFGTILLFGAMFTLQKKKLDRMEALLLLVVYAVYLFFLIQNEIG